MGLYRQSARNIASERGSAVIILTILFLIIILVLSFFMIEKKMLLVKKDAADDSVTFAELAALKASNSVKMAYGEYYVDPDVAYNVFVEYLKRNLKLDDSLNPLPGSIANSKVTIYDFKVYNPGEYPTTCPLGTPITRTSIHAVIGFSAKRPILKGLFGNSVFIKVHKDTDNFYDISN